LAAASTIFARAAKKLDRLLKEFPDEHLDRALRVFGEQLEATKKIYDLGEKKLIDIPDKKVRQGAALAILAYKLGRPVERSENVHLHATTEDFKLMLARIRESKGAQRRLPADLVNQVENGLKAQDVATD
jgi:hypothetical protein